MKAIKHFFWTLVFLLVVVIGGAIAYAYSGWYDMSVGSGHTAPVQWYLNTLRYNSIKRAAADIRVPPLDESGMVEAGAQAYDRACAGCHGRPGRDPSDSWEPAPPALTRHSPDPAYNFWVVRNGIKMSAMPKIGPERVSDEQVWEIMAFLEESPGLTEGEYRTMVEPPEPEPAPEEAEDMAGDADEGDGESAEAESEGNDSGETSQEEPANDAGEDDGGN
ncbi:MAG: c-type cytochrome [Candidatus Wenzhouxiangella sp. M2_3B_020]